jgi:hypothetical protein
MQSNFNTFFDHCTSIIISLLVLSNVDLSNAKKANKKVNVRVDIINNFIQNNR